MCARSLKAIAPDAQPHPELDAATLNHLHLRVDNLDAAQAFYEKHFGWEPLMAIPSKSRSMRFFKDRRGFLLVLELHPDKGAMPSWFHLGFQLSTREAVREAQAYFEKEGVTFIDSLTDSADYASFTIADEDGYHLQIYWDSKG